MSLDLTPDQIAEFKENGVLVIENVLTSDEVDISREALHHDIFTRTGILHQSPNWGEIGARLKGPGMYIYYARWKLLNIHLHPNVTSVYEQLLTQTYGSGVEPNFEHPFGECTNHLTMVDRVCYRLPDYVSTEGGLSLHLDRNPLDPYLLQAGGLDKWRPIQGFVTLTDNIDTNSGGLKVVNGFHTIIDDYFKGSSEAVDACGRRGEFFRMINKSHAKVQKQLNAVYAPKGSLVLWDSRIPHATCDRLLGGDSREVIYTGFLPNTAINRHFIDIQREAIDSNKYPLYGPKHGGDADKDWEIHELTEEQKMRLGYIT
jgi:hypothetical protein